MLRRPDVSGVWLFDRMLHDHMSRRTGRTQCTCGLTVTCCGFAPGAGGTSCHGVLALVARRMAVAAVL
jgi:hypothetical protein